MLTRDVSEGLDDLLVAHVTRVSGTAIRAKVLAEKNEAYLIHDGELIRNVSVGGYVRMPYGFSDIVGVIEGEEQVEVPPSQGVDEGREFRNISFERFIDISVFGTMRGGKMVRGSIFLPLVSSAVYVLTNEELALINSFQNDDDPRSPFRVGWLATQPEIGVFVPMSNLFASHIGIFGNTGKIGRAHV